MKRKLILCVDDDEEMLKILRPQLEDWGYEVASFSDGPTALAELGHLTPDLMIIDLRMQYINGFELYQRIRKLSAFVKTPVFFLTAVDDPLAANYGKGIGADAYLTKPIDLDKLEALIREKLEKT